MVNWSDVYEIYSGSCTNSVAASTDIDLQAVYSSHVLQVAVTACGGTQVIQWRGSLDGVTWYDVGANPQTLGSVTTAVYTSNVPARHIHVDLYTISGTNTIAVTGASKE